jgi:Uma2 family endonuclease
MTIEEFLTWQTQQARKFEFVDGHPVGMAGAKLRHDRVTGNAFAEIRRQLRAGGSPCDAFTSDIGIRTAPSRIRRPEVSVLCPPFDEDATISDRPRLIVEVLSESTERIDRLVKLDEYKTIETLGYIVVVDPTQMEVGFWFRDVSRGWLNETLADPDAIVRIPPLGLAITLATLYERVPLTPRPRPKLVWEDEGA